ncbi:MULTISPECIES: hypothetical protein [Bacillus]|uniref:Uncharacterized protein n=1 Tax=Bacillus capparidis TaxID=1840411 RepID=A0ABS4CQ57_9BACI|nr:MULTISPECIES: hypothetical protein [Bacillus]MBP1079713.1 hypothetical protein [Bacillus capparidis]MED1095110.1 hypothetical protein [Bacillus capparidis]
MKKFKMIVVALVAALLVPSYTFASSIGTLGAGEWDYLGEETLYSNGAESHVYASTGGDYRICRDKYVGPDSELKVELWEYDPTSYNDYVGTRYLGSGECGVFRGIGSFVDGGDEAEFFAKSRTSSDMHLIFYD